jgi:Xaa-Pro dipeptidase
MFKSLKEKMKTVLDKINEVQHSLRKSMMDGWLLYDFRRSNPLALTFLDIPKETLLSRRFFYWIPKQGNPIKIVSQIETHALNHLPGETKVVHVQGVLVKQ